ncbi:Appr-1-processing protein [Xanthomonas phage Xoo-sp13]|nr:Appr-1-processing protein [Xanthomonas phage Xoo-sp13]
MGSGVALAIKTKWPEAFDAYRSHKQSAKNLGKVQFVNIDSNLYVGNCWTQEFFGKDGRVYADIDAVKKALITCFEFCEDYELELKSPKIAAGLAGLDWDTQVAPIFASLEECFSDVVVKIYVID